MRGDQRQGRFKIATYEEMSNDEGIVDDLRIPVGTQVDWYVWNTTELITNLSAWVDPIYDTSNETLGGGIQWDPAVTIPVISAQVQRGDNLPNERGFYTTDTMRLIVAVADLNRLLPDVIDNPTEHIKDFIIYLDDVFRPTRVAPRGRYAERYSVVTIDCNQVNSEELVNYPQFQSYAN